MNHVHHPRRDTTQSNRSRAFHPSLDGLEDRMLLYATIGAKWMNSIRVTYSIVADGTSIGGIPSNLQQKLNVYWNWQQEIRKAAAVWEAVAGINLVQVPDDGTPIGSSGYQQGDPYSGDIRIGGMSQSGNQLGFAYVPQPFNGGAIAGDIFFNTDQWWQINATTYDLRTVAIHEFGHALGMGHSEIATATMYAGYNAAKQSSTSDDSSGLRTIYGSRPSDRFDASVRNNSSTYATDLTPYFDGSGRISQANLDISSGADVDWYKVIVPATGSMTVSMQSSQLSSLIPMFTIYNESLQSLGTVTGGRYGDTVTVTIAGVQSNQVLYVKAMAGATGPAGIGAYGLQVNVGSNPQAALAPPYTSVASQPDQNPTTSSMGTGWQIEGQFIPYLGKLKLDGNGNLGALTGPGILDGLYRITYGTLSGYGSAEVVDRSAPPIRASGAGVAHRNASHAVRSPGALFGHPSGPSAAPTVDERSGPRSMFLYRSERPERAKAVRLQPLNAAMARVRHRRVVNENPSMSPSGPLRLGAFSRGHQMILTT